MSVLACERNGCERILCDRLILNGSRYICSDCYNDLREERRHWPSTMVRSEVATRIEDFMDSEVPHRGEQLDRDGIDEEFDRLTGERT